MYRYAFTMIELIFVIVIMGIIGQFGAEFLAQSYNSFIYSKVNNVLQANSAMAVETISSRLQYRIKNSLIARKSSDGSLLAIQSAGGLSDYNILEWVAADIEGFRGDTLPYWSGIIDMDASDSTFLLSPNTNTDDIDDLISSLSYGDSGVNDAALFFIGSTNNVRTDYSWDNTAGPITTQGMAMHPIKQDSTQLNRFLPVQGHATGAGADNSFSGEYVYEYYQLAWTAYAVGISDYDDGNKTGTLKLFYDYQPWQGEEYTDGKSAIIMENVSSFQFTSSGTVLKIQVCVNNELLEDYSLCKEKTIF